MKVYSLYIFDFDNTLFDTRRGLDAILSHAFPVIGQSYDESRFTEFVGMTMEQIFDSLSTDGSRRQEFYDRFKEVVRSDAYLDAEPFPETKRVLEELRRRGRKVAIASGKYRYKILRLMEEHGMADLVPEVVVGYEETERHKPDPDPILRALSFFDVP